MAENHGPPTAGVAHINKHSEDNFSGVLACSWTPAKGRILRATKSFQEGEVIFKEKPLHIVQEQEKSDAFQKLKELCDQHRDDFDYEPLWYWCAIQSLTKEELENAVPGCTGVTAETQYNLRLLHHEKVLEPTKAAELIVSEIAVAADPRVVESLIQIWVLNCFEYSDDPQAYSTYFFSSFMSHSCFPNAVWHYSGADHVLRCRREIKVGDEVCISYLPESGLLQSAPARRMELNDTKRFWCDCERCAPGVSDLSRGLKCPGCSAGIVFAKTPAAGPAQDARLLPSQLVGAVCSSCSHALTKAEAGKLAALEKKLKDLVDDYSKEEPKAIAMLQKDEQFIDQHFVQHVLADLAWEQLCSKYVEKRLVQDQLRLLRRRCEFHKAAYKGLSGAHAWALEALGDCLRSVAKKGAVGAEDNLKVARQKYSEANNILRLMFGEDHEYVTDIDDKMVGEED